VEEPPQGPMPRLLMGLLHEDCRFGIHPLKPIFLTGARGHACRTLPNELPVEIAEFGHKSLVLIAAEFRQLTVAVKCAFDPRAPKGFLKDVDKLLARRRIFVDRLPKCAQAHAAKTVAEQTKIYPVG